MVPKLKSLRCEFCFSFEHSIACFPCPAGFGNDDYERLRKVIVRRGDSVPPYGGRIDLVEDAIETVWVSVIKKVDVHQIAR